MARKKFEEGFKENAIEYCKTHSDRTIKACAAELGIGYSTLRRWIAQSEEQLAAEAEGIQEAMQDEAASVEATVDATESVTEEKVEAIVDNEPVVTEDEILPSEEVPETVTDVDIEEDDVVEDIVEDVDDEIANKREGVKSQLGELIETAGSGMSEAVQLIGLYKKRHELKKVQKKLRKEKERRLKK